MINKDFREFIELLNKNNVKYLIIGGYALAIHGYPRYTNDLDIWIWVDNLNAKNIIKSIEQFGFSSLNLSTNDFLKPDYVIQLGQPPNRIDILTSADGLEFEESYKSKVTIKIQKLDINFIDLENLKKNKMAVGRYQDLADLEKLNELDKK